MPGSGVCGTMSFWATKRIANAAALSSAAANRHESPSLRNAGFIRPLPPSPSLTNAGFIAHPGAWTDPLARERGDLDGPRSSPPKRRRAAGSGAQLDGVVAVALWLILLLSVSGCAHYTAQPISAERAAAEFESHTLADPALRAFMETNLSATIAEWPLPAWDFPHLALAAFYFHPDLDIARARLATTRAAQTSAAARPNPSLSVSPAYNSTTHLPSPWLVTATLDLPLETAGKRGYRVAGARHLSEAARLELATVAWQVRGRLRRALIGFHAAREAERLLRQQQSTQEQVVHSLESQLAAGAVSPFEVTQARVGLDRTRLALHDAERQRAEAHAQLAAAVGLPASALDPAVLSLGWLSEPPPALPPAEARRHALFNRTDILGALADYAARESALQLEMAKQYPDVHLNPGYEFDQGDNKWSLGLSVTLPVLNRNQGPIAEAEARRAEAAAQFSALQARVLAEIDRAQAAARAASAKAATADALQANVKGQEQAIQIRLAAGEVSRLELLTTELELSQTELARLDALVKAHEAFGDLEDALQSPVGSPLGLPTDLTTDPRPPQTRTPQP